MDKTEFMERLRKAAAEQQARKAAEQKAAMDKFRKMIAAARAAQNKEENHE